MAFLLLDGGLVAWELDVWSESGVWYEKHEFGVR